MTYRGGGNVSIGQVASDGKGHDHAHHAHHAFRSSAQSVTLPAVLHTTLLRKSPRWRLSQRFYDVLCVSSCLDKLRIAKAVYWGVCKGALNLGLARKQRWERSFLERGSGCM